MEMGNGSRGAVGRPKHGNTSGFMRLCDCWPVVVFGCVLCLSFNKGTEFLEQMFPSLFCMFVLSSVSQRECEISRCQCCTGSQLTTQRILMVLSDGHFIYSVPSWNCRTAGCYGPRIAARIVSAWTCAESVLKHLNYSTAGDWKRPWSLW